MPPQTPKAHNLTFERLIKGLREATECAEEISEHLKELEPRMTDGNPFSTLLARSWIDEHHHQAGICPECQQDCTTQALTGLAVTFEDCNCGYPEYGHLVEQLHHKSCFEKGG